MSADDIKPRKLDFLHVESKQGITDRINRQIKEQINPLIQKNRALEHNNATLSNENKELKENNSKLTQSLKDLTKELKKIYSALCIPFKDTIKERLNSFKGWLDDFIFGEKKDIDEMRFNIFNKVSDNKQYPNIDDQLNEKLGYCSDKTTSQATNTHKFKL